MKSTSISKRMLVAVLFISTGLMSKTAARDLPVLEPGYWNTKCATSRMTDVHSCEWSISLERTSAHPMGVYTITVSDDGPAISIVGAPRVVAATLRVDRNKALNCEGSLCFFSKRDSAALLHQMKVGQTLLVSIAHYQGGFEADVGLAGFSPSQTE